MNAVDVLRHQHRKIVRVLSEFQTVATQRSPAFDNIRNQLMAHAEAEQQVFYPALEQWASDEVEEAIEEHRTLEEILVEMIAIDMDAFDFSRKLRQLMTRVQDHIGDEEAPGGLMDVARRNLSEEQLSELAGQILAVLNREENNVCQIEAAPLVEKPRPQHSRGTALIPTTDLRNSRDAGTPA